MTQPNLPTRLAQALAFDLKTTQSLWSQRHARGIHQVEGAMHENERLAPLHRALVECVTAANSYLADEDNVCDCEHCFACEFQALMSPALASLEAALSKGSE